MRFAAAVLHRSAPAPPGGGISFVGATSDASDDATELTLDLAGVATQADDFAVLFYYSDDSNQSVFSEVDTPTGWTLEPNWPVTWTATRRRKLWLFTRRLTGGDPDPTLDVNNNQFRNRSAVLAVYRGVDTTTALDATPVISGRANDPSPALNGITTTTPNAAIVQCLAATHGPTPFVPPSSYELAGFASPSSWHGSSAVAHNLDVGQAGDKVMGPWTTAGSGSMDSAGITLALRRSTGG
jgi:hypothetical protein